MSSCTLIHIFEKGNIDFAKKSKEFSKICDICK